MTDDFSGLGLSPKVTDAVAAAGYTKPTDIQAQAIPHVLQKQDIIGIAQTGTGKTASFVLPMLTLLESGRARARMPRTLILEPTRELAAQVHENFEKYGKNHRLSVALLIGGVSFEEQNKKLDRGADVLIATPGRMLDQFERGRILLNGVDLLVIDEADRMLDMGFVPDIERICSLLPARRQTLFFSATMPPEIEKLTRKFLRDPVRIQVARQNSTAENIDQKLVRVGSKPDQKREALRQQIRAADGLTNAIVFCNRKRDVAMVAKSLARHGFDAGELHGDMDQKRRTETLDAFRSDRLSILVASDVAARGLDIPAVSHVYNFDVPVHAEDYVHRIGRTGRAGRSGVATTLVTGADSKHLDAIVKLIQQDIPFADNDTGAPADQPENAATAEEAKPAKRRRGATRERGQVKARPATSTEPQSETVQQTQPEPQVPADAVEETRTAKTRTPARSKAPKRPQKESNDNTNPFGNDGPIPAFLLRTSAWSN
ncbi:DEAD/DEAH box helicase [Devosia algicola]|uniref:DEAD/DEAH box helicase n=1 Tax=Devosia algicola TaxID=3026418 RepID=A0ABY7YQ93_9HYPH|nr:DEAD/DEAH box helicase [Devosia algicola]WDR03424.1 DEAD/DEAH box helicase [Devosia algicola]